MLNFAAGNLKQELVINQQLTLKIGGNAHLITFIGHDGLMDFTLDSYPEKSDQLTRELVILACKSKQFFKSAIIQTQASPLVLTTNLMAPEAYTLYAIIDGWSKQKTPKQIKTMAAMAYSKYQKISLKASLRLFTETL